MSDDREYLENSSNAITPVLPTEKPDNSLSMGDEHLSTILEMESDKVIKSSVENLVPIPSESEIESLNDNPIPDCMLKSPSSSFLSYTDNFSPEFDTFSYHTDETSAGSTTTHANNSLPEYDSFLFKIEPDQGKLTSVVMNDISDNLTNDPLIEEVNLFLASDNSIPPGIENVDYDSKGDILFL
nr:hypothetical protein [Tanacetum cinerariifolium]